VRMEVNSNARPKSELPTLSLWVAGGMTREESWLNQAHTQSVDEVGNSTATLSRTQRHATKLGGCKSSHASTDVSAPVGWLVQCTTSPDMT
jgi:hypothetical protein